MSIPSEVTEVMRSASKQYDATATQLAGSTSIVNTAVSTVGCRSNRSNSFLTGAIVFSRFLICVSILAPRGRPRRDQYPCLVVFPLLPKGSPRLKKLSGSMFSMSVTMSGSRSFPVKSRKTFLYKSAFLLFERCMVVMRSNSRDKARGAGFSFCCVCYFPIPFPPVALLAFAGQDPIGSGRARPDPPSLLA